MLLGASGNCGLCYSIHVFFFKDCLTTGHIEGLQNLVDPGSISWTRNELDLEQASKASCIIALCGWTGR